MTNTTLSHQLSFTKRLMLSSSVAVMIGLSAGVASVHALQATDVKNNEVRKAVHFDLPAMPLSEALVSFSQKTNIIVLAPENVVDQKMTGKLKGDFTPQEAIKILLKDSGISFEFKGTNTVIIRHPGSGRILQNVGYKVIKVNSDADYENNLGVFDDDDNRGDVTTTVFDEIVVTATRREVSLQDLALSVSALSQKKLQNIGARDYADYLLTVPGVSFVDEGGRSKSYTIRGIPSMGQSATTAFYLDETPINIDPRLFDVSRVEVLRGPQGTLFGASSMGGAIRTITIKPNMTDVEGMVETTLAKTERGGFSPSISAAVSLPIVEDKLAIRVVGHFEQETGVVDNHAAIANSDSFPVTYTPGNLVEKDLNDQKVWGGRIALRWLPRENLNVTANFYFHQDKYSGIDNEDVSIFGEKSYKQFRPLAEVGQDKSRIFNLTGEQDFDSGILTVSSSYEKLDTINTIDATQVFRGASLIPGGPLAALSPIANTPLGALSAANITGDSRRWTHEARYTSNLDGAFQFIAGAYYSDFKSLETQDLMMSGLGAYTATSDFATSLNDGFFTVVGLPPLGAIFQPGLAAASVDDGLDLFVADSSLEEISFFGEASYEINDKMELTVGLRQYNIKSNVATANTGFFPTFGSCMGNLGAILFDGAPCLPLAADVSELKAKESGLTYKANLTVRPVEDVLLYASITTGYRPGGANTPVPLTESAPGGLAAIPLQYNSDSLTQYELGWRTSFWDGQLTFNGSAFYIDWTDIQTVLNTEPTGVSFTANVGKARSKGLELEFVAKPTEAFTADIVFSLMDAEFTEDFTTVVTKGDPIPNIPNVSSRVGLQYDFMNDFNARIDWTHVGQRKEAANDPDPLKAYDLFNFRLGYSQEDWGVTVYVNNIFDSKIILGDSENPISNIRRIHYTQPRTYGLTTYYKF